MTMVHSPTAGRRRLRHMLRHARDQIGFTQDQVATAMDWSLSKVIRIETGAVSISTNDLRQLLQLYQVDDPQRVAELVELARVGRRRPWWTRYRDLVPTEYLSYVGLEDESRAIYFFNPAGMPGLLQNKEFAHALVAASWWAMGTDERSKPLPAELAARVEIRMTRQREVLHRNDPPRITAVLDEAVLRREIGGAAVLRKQLQHLDHLAAKEHITIRVLPFSANISSILSPFAILEFPDPADPDVVYTESVFEQNAVLDGKDVAMYRRVFAHLRDSSLSKAESQALIIRIAEELAPASR